MRILMVSTEYPPMRGGVGRYAANLSKALKNQGIEVSIVCDEKGAGEYNNAGLSPKNAGNSEVLSRLVDEIKPDIVHVQFEPGLYGLVLDLADPRKSRTYIDSFYSTCKVPIVTTFHSAYSLGEWIAQGKVTKSGRFGKKGIPARIVIKTWRNLINYRPYREINRQKLRKSWAGISFSRYSSSSIGGGKIIYHGAEPAVFPIPSKQEARSILSLPQDKMLAVAIGFRTIGKGWDILDRLEMPPGWSLVLNSSQSHYNTEGLSHSFTMRDGVIDLQKGFLSEEELSTLLCACDAVLLPYRIASGSGVMFDALAHGLPFVASNLEFFKEFEELGLGVTCKRSPTAFSYALAKIGEEREQYSRAVDRFKSKLTWTHVANQHVELYQAVVEKLSKAKLAADPAHLADAV